jgi:site-specific DNA-methyltransferase (adenine-specific)
MNHLLHLISRFPHRLFDNGNIAIINADCLGFLKMLPEKSIGLVLTDPPYGIDYTRRNSTFGVSPRGYQRKRWDRRPPPEEYFRQIFRVSRNQIIFGGNYFTEYLKPTKSWVVWDKVGLTNCDNKFSQCELIWTSLSCQTKKYTVIQQGFIHENKQDRRIHPTQKPVKLLGLLLASLGDGVGDIILDPFSGSASTAVACYNHKIPCICIERDEEYYEQSCERLEEITKELMFNFEEGRK